MADPPNQDDFHRREANTPDVPVIRKIRDMVVDHSVYLLVLGAFGIAALFATVLKDYMLDLAKASLGIPGMETRLANTENSLKEIPQAAATAERRLQEMSLSSASAREKLEERLATADKRLQEQMRQTESEHNELTQRLSSIESHLHNVTQAASSTVDTVYVFKHEFVFPHPVESLSDQLRNALARCAFDDVDVPREGDLAEYFKQLTQAATMNESFRFRADVGTRAELQYDVRCYSSEGANYQYPNPLDLEIHVNGILLPRHQRNWSHRDRDTMRPLDSMTESVGAGSLRVHQLSVILAQNGRICPSHFPKVVSGQLSLCTFDGLIHVSDRMPTLQPLDLFPSLAPRS